MYFLCLICNCEEYVVREDRPVYQLYKGKELYVKTPCIVCKKCGWQTIANDQLDVLCERTKELYARVMDSERVDS